MARPMTDTPDALAEREAIVAWLRDQARDCEREQDCFQVWRQEWLYLREQIETFETAADAIELGEHHKGKE
jgi:hypothetical protein